MPYVHSKHYHLHYLVRDAAVQHNATEDPMHNNVDANHKLLVYTTHNYHKAVDQLFPRLRNRLFNDDLAYNHYDSNHQYESNDNNLCHLHDKACHHHFFDNVLLNAASDNDDVNYHDELCYDHHSDKQHKHSHDDKPHGNAGLF